MRFLVRVLSVLWMVALACNEFQPMPVTPEITTSALEDGTVGSPYSGRLRAAGGTGPYTWSLESVPAELSSWLHVDSATGALSGIPAANVSPALPFVVRVTDSWPTPRTSTRTLTLAVKSCAPGATVSCNYIANGQCLLSSLVCSGDGSVLGTCSGGNPSSNMDYCGSSCGACSSTAADKCSSGTCKCGSTEACSGATDTCTNQVCKCGGNAACSGTTDTCTGGVCKCGTQNACSGTADTCTSGVCKCGSTEACSGAASTCCSSSCKDLQTDSNNCGSCGNICPTFSADQLVALHMSGVACQDGKCIAVCTCGQNPRLGFLTTFGDCDNDLSNGCETSLVDDLNNCGSCGSVCNLGPASCCYPVSGPGCGYTGRCGEAC